MLKKLRLKFILTNMCIVMAMLLVIFATVFHFTKTDLDRQGNAMLQSLAQSVRQPTSRNPGRDIQLPYFILEIYLNGDIRASGYTYFDLTDEALLQDLITQVFTAGKTEGKLPKYQLLFKNVSSLGVSKLIFLDVSSHKATLATLVESCALIGLCSMVVFLVISILLARWAIKPVEKAWEQQRQFVSDASHELKTPLTVILSNAELLQNPDCEPEHKAQFVQSIVTMSQRMRTLVESLLDLARGDNGNVRQNFEELDFSQLTEDALLPFEPMLFEKGLLLESNIEKHIAIRGSSAHLQQLIGILLDNAGKYACPGIVSVKLMKQGRNHCLLTVSNPGAPIPKEALQRIFDRFYRADTARTGGSFGLGLSIAKSIAENHDGKIWAQSNQTGNCFFIQLPMV